MAEYGCVIVWYDVVMKMRMKVSSLVFSFLLFAVIIANGYSPLVWGTII